MKITIASENVVSYEQTVPGDVFLLDGEVYIATNILENGLYDEYVSVNLASGKELEIGREVKVQLLQAELIVNNFK